jgi:hypothetical protein
LAPTTRAASASWETLPILPLRTSAREQAWLLEDAHVLSSLLGRCTSTSELLAAFRVFDYAGVPRTTRVMAASRGQGNLVCFEGPDAGSDLEKVAELIN